MTLEDIKHYFGTSYNFEKLTGMSHTNYGHWSKSMKIPYSTQMYLEIVSAGALKATREILEAVQDDCKEGECNHVSN